MKTFGLRTHIQIHENLPEIRDWYAKLFETKAYFDKPFYVGFDIAGYELGLFGKGDALAYWAVDDVEAAVKEAVDAGATVFEKPNDVGDGIIVGAVNDPFGNTIGFIHNPNFAPKLTAQADDLAEPLIFEWTVPANAKQCFDAWSTSEGIGSWWTTNHRIERRIGGHYELYFMPEEPYGKRGSEHCRVLSFLPNKMFSFSWNAPPQFEKTRYEHTWVVLEFEENDGQTIVRLTHTGWPAQTDEVQWEQTKDYFKAAWPRVLERFATQF